MPGPDALLTLGGAKESASPESENDAGHTAIFPPQEWPSGSHCG
jgi:hypothetical protein